ncbi:MmgE/PrpD family protein [Pleomorphovibrio marinus]|uniref:MmgE/PrpD family protein n=1 Tax=Pleomorphovibrio marinus TaxID=2164132 RepID=UPI000E0AEB4A|nr:MmgE/PrpD family protein [Pleomorphovibrio marinus]
MNIKTDNFLDYLTEFFEKEIIDKDKRKAKDCLLDYLGVTIAGSYTLFRNYPELRCLASSEGGAIKVIGVNETTSLLNAALLNGMAAHVLELDDGYRYGMVHPGAVIFSALLPIAQKFNISGDTFLRSTVVAYEACLRLSKAMQPVLKEKGLHATGVVAGVGAAIGIGFALGYSRAQLKSVLTASCTSASGLLEVIRDESQLKPYNSAQAAMNGMAAGLFGKAGMHTPDDILGGNQGFFTAHSKISNIDSLLEPNKSAMIQEIYVKPYAACRHAHAPIDAVLYLKAQFPIDICGIDSVTIETYKYAVALHDHQVVESSASAKMSTPYSVAVALIHQSAGLEEFYEEIISQKDVKSLCKRIHVIENVDFTKLVPQKRSAKVSILMNNRQLFEHQVDFPKGEPENAMTSYELKEKFYKLAEFANVPKDNQNQILKTVDKLEYRISDLYRYV